LRDKIIVHGRALVGSMRNFDVYRKINRSFGRLSEEDKQTVQKLIRKYGENNTQILSIQSHPNLMLDDFLGIITQYNIRLEDEDQTELGQLAQRNGAKIDVIFLSEHIRKFLEDTASLFPLSK